VAETTTLAPLDLAARLDAANLFLRFLSEHPAFAADRESLEDLAIACSFARDGLEASLELDQMEVERRAEEFLQQRDLYDVDGRGIGPAVLELQQQTLELARFLYGEDASWDRENGRWDRGEGGDDAC
jgi:hypothetical protein